MRRLCILVCLVGLGLAASAAAIDLLDVPLEDGTYALLERLEIRARLPRSGLVMRPLTRGACAALVEELGARAARGDWVPTAIETAQLDLLRAEFSEERAARGATDPILQRARHVWERPGWRLQAFWGGGTRVDQSAADPARTDARLVLDPAVALAVGEHFVAAEQVVYRVRTGDGTFAQSADVRDGEAEYLFAPGDRFTITRSVAPYVRGATGRWRFDLGRFRLRWGPGRFNALLVADHTPPFDQASVRATFGPVRFTHLVGQLRAAQLRSTDPVLRERYVAVHRLEWAAHPRLTLALSEALVWGDRGIDLAYANPINVLFVTQANNGDQDNALAGFDVRWLGPGRSLLYAEGVADDLNLRRGLRHFGNKLAFLGGGVWAAPFGARDWDFEAEWSWASTYTYTHVKPINRFQHFAGALGSRTGPDAEIVAAAMRRALTRGWSAALVYERIRRGEGGLAFDHDTRTSDRQSYLSGVVETRHAPGLAVQYRGLRTADLDAELRWVRRARPDHDAARAAEKGLEARFGTRFVF